MRISVITVAYNSARTIGDTLRSVAAQTHGDIEHILVDGASTDGTLGVVEREGGHVARVLSEPDRGIYDAMNKGIRLATGELVGFLNADDVFAYDAALDDLDALASRHPAAVALFADLDYVSATNPEHAVRRWRSGAFSRTGLRRGWMPPHPTFYVRQAEMSRLGGFDSSLRIAADYDFILRCLGAPQAQAVYLPKVLVHMRLGGASNRSLRNLLIKSREDLGAMRRNGVGGVGTLVMKNLRKLPQFLQRG